MVRTMRRTKQVRRAELPERYSKLGEWAVQWYETSSNMWFPWTGHHTLQHALPYLLDRALCQEPVRLLYRRQVVWTGR